MITTAPNELRNSVNNDVQLDIGDIIDIPLPQAPKAYQQISTKHSTKWTTSFVEIIKHPRFQVICISLTSFILLAIMAVLIFVHYYIPHLIQSNFADYTTSSKWPAMDFQTFTNETILFNMSYTLPFTSFVDTKIHFEGPFTFATGGNVITNITFPDIDVGYNRPYLLNQTLQVNLVDISMWTLLWKKWILRCTDLQAPAYIKAPTMWDISGHVSITMLGYTWRNVLLHKVMEWNGGLSPDQPLIKMKLESWNLSGSFTHPGLELILGYNNTVDIGINFGEFQFAVYSMYQTNSTFAMPVNILQVGFPSFYYQPGQHNVTIQNNFTLYEPKSLLSAAQLGTDFLLNKTSTLVLKDFQSRHDGNPVTWLNDVFTSLSFVLQLNRQSTLLNMARLKAGKFLQTSFSQSSDFSPDNWDEEQPQVESQMEIAGNVNIQVSEKNITSLLTI